MDHRPLSQERATATSSAIEPTQPPDLGGIFFAGGEERLDRQTREEALAWLLDHHAGEPVAAFSENGFFAEMPSSIPLGESPVMEGRSGLDGVSDESGRQALIERWERMLRRGAGVYVLPRPGLPDLTIYWLDVRDIHGVIFAVITGTTEDERAEHNDDARVLARPTARFTSLRKDERANILAVDETFSEILGWSPEEVVGKRSLDLLHPDDHALSVENWMEMISRPGPARSLRQRWLHKNGAWVWFEVTNHNLFADPGYGCVTSEMADISEEMAAQEALRAREQLLDRLTAALPVGVLQIDTARRVVFTNERLQDILGVPPADRLEDQLATVLAADRGRLDRAIEAVLGNGANVELDVAVQPPEGAQARRCTMTFRALTHDDGTVSGAIACIDDVTERARMQDELERRATFDDLTGCHNRASVVSALEESIARGRGKAERAVMFVDLDGFKDVNDRQGHAAGDRLLRHVAELLFEAVRESDIVGRIGGDEFLVVCPDIGGPEAAMRLAERVAETINRDALDGPAGAAGCQVSIGVTWSAGRELDADALVALADRAMYESKRDGHGTPTLARAA